MLAVDKLTTVFTKKLSVKIKRKATCMKFKRYRTISTTGADKTKSF